jgi:hypothetical protein
MEKRISEIEGKVEELLYSDSKKISNHDLLIIVR